MSKFQPPQPPFVEAHNVGGKQRPTAITLTLSQTTSDKGAALATALYLHSANAPARSFHYVVDEAETYRGVWDNVAAAHNPYRSLAVHICAQPHEAEAMWEDATASKVLYRAADLVAELMLVHKIPAVYLTGGRLARWKKHRWRRRGGLIIDVPGVWPYASFLSDVLWKLDAKRDERNNHVRP